MRKALGAVVLVLSASCAFALQPPKETAEQLRARTFERVWQIVDERFYDPHFHGLDWKAAHRRYAPLIARAGSPGEFYDLLNQMLGELKQSHMRVYPPWDYYDQDTRPGASASEWASLDSGAVVSPGDSGMTVQVVEGRPVVTRVEKGSGAGAAGIRAGFVVVEVRGVDLADQLRQLAGGRPSLADRDRDLGWMVQGLLSGGAGETVSVKVLDELDRPRTVPVTLKAMEGEPCNFGEMPTLFATMEAKKLPLGVAYLRFNAFLLPLMERIKAAIDSFQGAKGLVIDLRGNPGGIAGITLPIAGRLVKKRALLGISRMRSGEYRLLAYPQSPRFDGPVAILIDERSASTSEILAAGLQECGRAIVVGRTSAGEALPSSFEKLPDGSRLQYVVAVFHTPKGVLLEGRGVIPDVPVKLTRKALLSGLDPALDKALAVLLSKAARARPAK